MEKAVAGILELNRKAALGGFCYAGRDSMRLFAARLGAARFGPSQGRKKNKARKGTKKGGPAGKETKGGEKEAAAPRATKKGTGRRGRAGRARGIDGKKERGKSIGLKKKGRIAAWIAWRAWRHADRFHRFSSLGALGASARVRESFCFSLRLISVMSNLSINLSIAAYISLSVCST